MPIPLAKTDQLFEHLWRPGHPYRPRSGPWRRWGMLFLLLLLCAIITGYIYLTDSNRVRELSERYLSELVGTPVHVGRATLSIFEGLKLRDVTVLVDQGGALDSLLFQAENIELQYEPKRMLAGKIVATRIIATSPHVRLTENIRTGRWNYQRLLQRAGQPATPQPEAAAPAPTIRQLPEIVLRNAKVEYTELRGEKLNAVGAITLEGRFWPNSLNSLCNFEMQSRGALEGIGPVATGAFDPSTGQLDAQLRNFRFGRDLTTMLPMQVRSWWQQHELDGRLNVPELHYVPNGIGGKPVFRIEMQLDGVRVGVHPEEWMSRVELDRLEMLRQSLESLEALGLRVPGVPEMSDLTRMSPVRLEKTAGTFVFTQDGIEIQDVVGRLEDNGFRVSGRIDGYSPDAPAVLRVSSLETENLRLPHAPRYVNSLPLQVREIYELLKPEGECSLALEIRRDESGQRPDINGEIRAIDAAFVFQNFPYPVRGATGRVMLGRDPISGLERADLRNLRGHGILGGPNENATVTLNGWIGPFDNRIGCDISIVSENARSEKALFDAFNPATRQALSLFDPEGKDGFPQMRGKFSCQILSSIGLRPDTTVTSEIELEDASGSFKAFPYPLQHVTGNLKVFPDHLDVGLKMQRNDAALAIDGSVAWKHAGEETKILPDLRVTTHHLPIDDLLLKSLSPDQQKWLKKTGLGGLIDLEGRILPGDAALPMTFDFSGKLHEATLWPVDGKPVVTGLSGAFHLTPDRLELKDFKAAHAGAELSAGGTVRWPEGQPKLMLTAGVRNLSLDDSLHRLLPATAQAWWDAIRPSGSIDAEATFNGAVPGAADPTAPAYQVVLRPKELSVNLQAFPYRLDKLDGAVEFLPDRTVLNHLTARHGAAEIAVSGKSIGRAGDGWDLQLSAQSLEVEKELLAALPAGVKSLAESIKLGGHLTIDCPKLQYRPGSDAEHPSFDMEGKISTADGTMELGVPLTKIDGAAALALAIRSGKLQAGAGKLDIASLRIADRPVKGLQADMLKPNDQSIVQFTKLQAELAGGELAGQIDLAFPEDSAGTYALNLVLRGSDVQELSRIESAQKIEGQISASLALEGAWNNPAARRGRGDVLVTGKQMYQIPVLLGLLEVTNLSLPISSPFAEGTARYSVEGRRVTFESIQLKSSSMTMSGSGYMDFGSKKVLLDFSTDNPNWPKLPFVSELVQNARQELLRIRVRGTVQEPKVSATPLHTFTTTIDEVLKGPEKK